MVWATLKSVTPHDFEVLIISTTQIPYVQSMTQNRSGCPNTHNEAFGAPCRARQDLVWKINVYFSFGKNVTGSTRFTGDQKIIVRNASCKLNSRFEHY